MWNTVRRHVRGNLVAYLALFLTLNGTAYAVKQATVGAKELLATPS